MITRSAASRLYREEGDGQSLADLMIEYDVDVRVDRALEFKRLDEGFFSDDE